MKRAPRSRQRHDLYAKYHDYDSEISDLLGECGIIYSKPANFNLGKPNCKGPKNQKICCNSLSQSDSLLLFPIDNVLQRIPSSLS